MAFVLTPPNHITQTALGYSGRSIIFPNYSPKYGKSSSNLLKRTFNLIIEVPPELKLTKAKQYNQEVQSSTQNNVLLS